MARKHTTEPAELLCYDIHGKHIQFTFFRRTRKKGLPGQPLIPGTIS